MADAALPTVPAHVLDHYLSQGYYRLGQDLFTTRFLPYFTAVYSVHWLRVRLARLRYGPRQRHLLRRNADLTVRVRPFALTAEHEALYAAYYDYVQLDTAPTLAELLLDGHAQSVFATSAVEVRDGDRLVAVGLFDQGQRSIMGIVNYYDPAYARRSPGKHLLLLKANYAHAQGMKYYYPGYLTYNLRKFDYKLFVDEAATEVFDCAAGRWVPFSWAEVARHSAALLATR